MVYYQGNITNWTNWMTVMYLRQAKLDKMSWAFWQPGLNLVFLRDDKQSLRVPLRDWYPTEAYHHQWKWNYAPSELYYQATQNDIIKQPKMTASSDISSTSQYKGNSDY
jgi:hypothetical protein